MSIADMHAAMSVPGYKTNGNKGVARAHKAAKRADADKRNAKTPFNRTRAYRLAQGAPVTVRVADFI